MRVVLVAFSVATVITVALPGAATERPPSQSAAAARAPTRPPAAAPQRWTQSLRLEVAEKQRVPIVLDLNALDARDIDRFIARAGAAVPAERETVRAVLRKAGGNARIASALAARAEALRTRDHSGALVALALLGELRGPTAEQELTKFVALPLPATGHMVEGVAAERTALEQLQMKAVQGIAYAHTATGDATVLRIAAQHPSRAVRAEAIEAYLYNHQYSAEAQKTLANAVGPRDRIFLDRPHLNSATRPDEFNAQLKRYLAAHPELAPATPSRHRRDAATLARYDRFKEAAIARAKSTSRRTAPPDRLK